MFVKGTDNALWHKAYDGNWSDFEQLAPNAIASDPAAVSWGNGRIDLFVRGADDALYHKWYDGAQKVAWPSIAQTPPSTVYPPDGVDKWFPRIDVTAALKTTANGRDLAILELRGWLKEIEPDCNPADPDWHYILELDIAWLRQIGVDPAELLRPGDVLGYADEDATMARHRTRIAAIEVELDAWPRKDSTRGNPAKPSDWTKTIAECQEPTATWPYDPRLDVAGKPLAAGSYVRVVGSAVTDEPHDQRDQLVTNSILRRGLVETRAWLSTLDPDHAMARLNEGAANAARWIYIESLRPNDPDNPARWNEMHSPDYIQILDGSMQKRHDRQLHQVMVCAQNGLIVGDTEKAALRLDAPPDRPPNTRLNIQRYVTRWTRQESVTEGPTVRLADDYATVSVSVQGDGAMGRSGKYYELYELWWEEKRPLAPVPDLREMSRDSAGAAVIAAGFVPAYTGASGANTWVVSQTPPGDSMAETGSTIRMQLRKGPPL